MPRAQPDLIDRGARPDEILLGRERRDLYNRQRPTDARVTLDELLAYCLAKPGAWRPQQWGDGVVAKVETKIFASLRPVGVPGGAPGARSVRREPRACQRVADPVPARRRAVAPCRPVRLEQSSHRRDHPGRGDPRGGRRLLRDDYQPVAEETSRSSRRRPRPDNATAPIDSPCTRADIRGTVSPWKAGPHPRARRTQPRLLKPP